MLTASQFDQLSTPITDLYEEYSQSVINDIARRLAKLDMTETAAWQMQRLTESGKLYEAVLEKLSQMTGKSEETLRQAFAAAGVKATRFDDAIFKAAGLEPVPINLSPAMVDVLKAGLQKTSGAMRNLTMTTALTSQQAFVDAADLAYVQVSGGAMSYDQAIRAAIKSVARSGLSVISYQSGRHDQLDVAMRRTVLTGITQTTGVIQKERTAEMGCDLVQTSAHAGARPSHAAWQGRVFSLSGKDRRYPNFVAVTGYGTPGGLCGINCRHSFYPFFEGISRNAYEKATVDEFDKKTVTYNGEEIPAYDATQIQRAIERKIRQAKREAAALDAAALDNSAELAAVRELQARMRSFVRQTRMVRQRERERI